MESIIISADSRQRIADILDDIKDNLELARTSENGQQIDYIVVRIGHLSDEMSEL